MAPFAPEVYLKKCAVKRAAAQKGLQSRAGLGNLRRLTKSREAVSADRYVLRAAIMNRAGWRVWPTHYDLEPS